MPRTTVSTAEDTVGGVNLVQVAAGQTWFDDVRAPYLRANVTYYYSIQGCNDDGCGPISSEDTGWVHCLRGDADAH